MMKQGLSIILTLCLTLCLFAGSMMLPAQAAFTDISDEQTALAAATLESMGVVTGTSGTTYNPGGTLTRAEFCAMAVRLMGLEEDVATYSYKTLFTDAPVGQWYTGYVNLAYAQGIINGYGNGKFGPNDPLTGGQLVTVCLRLLGYNSSDIGAVWPVDYVNYAAEIGLSDGVTVNGTGSITRGNAAKILYNLLNLSKKGSSIPYYQSISGVSSTVEAIVLDTNASSGGNSGYLMAATVGGSSVSVETYAQKNQVSSTLSGQLGHLLIGSSGKVVGFVPTDNETVDLIVFEAKPSTLTASSGVSYRISSGATVISAGSTYPYASSGYIQVNNASGRTARLFYDDSGNVDYIYLGTGLSGSSGEAVVAETNSPASELARALGISSLNYTITKNGASADVDDLARYDVAYYDAATGTMCVSDYQITGYIEAASPNMAAAETITVAGCTMDVLECAWDTLDSFTLGKKVTLLLTDDNKVAAAYSPSSSISADMIGVLSTNGSSVTLSDSGLVLSASEISADNTLRGSVVRVTASANKLSCCALDSKSGKVDIEKNTLGSYEIAPSCAIYEWGGSGYVYNLSGTQGTASRDFSEIFWTDSLSSSYVSRYELNSAGQVDVIVLKDATGNYYQYGKLTRYEGEEGINLGMGTMTAYNNAVTITNSSGTISKYICSYSTSGSYSGIVLKDSSSNSYKVVSSVAKLYSATDVDDADFFAENGKWYALVKDYEIPVSNLVEVYISSVGKWYSGEEGLLTAISSGLDLTVYYDRTMTTGAQVRMIVVG
ncbi:MAG: S-layer homology domain-containing protein [Butyricicoccaceae bacterium]